MLTDFSFLNDSINMNLYTIILFIIEIDKYCFNCFCFENFFDNDRDNLKEIIKNWHIFQNNSKICVYVDEQLK